jgi:hypothetical protein
MINKEKKAIVTKRLLPLYDKICGLSKAILIQITLRVVGLNSFLGIADS